jgi:Ser/Thr protein kinase RdoA (MazF antagonist)
MNAPLSHDDLLARLGRLAHEAIALYDLSPRSTATMINLSENATYRIDDPESGGKTILRIHRVGYHSYAAINSELQWMAALRRDAGMETPEAIPARDGTVIQTLVSPELRDPRHAVMSKFMSGREPPEDELMGPFERLGEVSARMHEHAKRWPLPPGFARHTWDYETSLGSRPIWGRWQDGIGMTAARESVLGRMSAAIGQRLQRYGMARERFGLTHADIRLANLLIEGTHTKVIDFDDCGFSWYLYDCATALSWLERESNAGQLWTQHFPLDPPPIATVGAL